MAAENLPITARLHVSQIPFDISEERLKGRFAKYGRVYEVCIRKGFAFVQLGTEEDADRAIASENGSLFEGRKIRVSLTNKTRFGKSINSDGNYNGGGREKDPYDSMDREMSRYGGRDLPPSRLRERSPLHDRYSDRFLDRYDDSLRDPFERDLRKRDRYFDERLPASRDRYDDRFVPEDDYRRDIAFRDRDRLPDRDRDRDRLDRDRRDSLDRPRRDIADREKDLRDHYDRRPLHGRSSDPSPRGASPGPSTPSLPLDDKPIDCEILLLGKHLRDYADLVERRLKGLALNTGLLLISIEASLPQALEDVARRKVLYAMILTSQNEVHRSVTLNILHGSPQEHRNMPLEDALSLVERNYTNYLQDRTAPAKLPPKAALPVAAAHTATALAAAAHAMPPLPSEPSQPRIQPPLPTAPAPAQSSGQTPATAMVIPNVELTIPQLINLLADRKQLTIQEMDRVIGHLQAVRRKMAIEQGVETDPVQRQNTQPKAMTDSPAQQAPVDTKHNELQAKILSIIHPGASGSATSTSIKTTPIMSSMPSATKMRFNPVPPAASTPSSRPVAGTPLSFTYGGSLASMGGTSAATKAPPVTTNKNINLDSPNVQKALDNLIQSGPTMLKQLATSSNMTKSINTMSKTQASNKAILDIKNAVSGKKLTGPKQEQIEAQLRAAQTAALQTLQQQQQQQLTQQQQQQQKQQQPTQQQQQQQQLQQQQAVLAVQAHMAQQAQQKQASQSTAQGQQLQQQQQQQQQLQQQQQQQFAQYPQLSQYQQQQQAQYQQQQAQYQQQQAHYLQQQQAHYQQQQQQQQGQPQQTPLMQVQGRGAQSVGSQQISGQTMPSANMGASVAGGNAMMQGGAGWPQSQSQQQRQPSSSYQQNQAKGANSKSQQPYGWPATQLGPPGT